ncbi:RNA polymerase sigma factor sigV [Solibacillus isronensis B3W22]|uniref:RNA polymerase sigma factor sigV n=1 Tax=Solibacillus isronensis B3W22 TaxID=1224748 RepID=K1KU15_9BACL|nr:sigma-70 family RNA polymerase sigma factor [Solibacillus isronensis]AMO85374.1 RNA polymerase subunit sigma-70 [Solibacillus silvestris]EKB43382.1 RNA polymerase sigma factor sigV [Solibacillus isronensis B3W22]
MKTRNTFQHEEVFVQFIRENKERFYLLAYSYTKNEQDALDVVQDSIQKAMIALNNIEKVDYMKSWFYKIVVRTAIDFLRKHKRLQVTDDETLHYLTPAQEDKYENVDLKHALAELPQMYSEIIILHYFEDLKIADVADILGIKLSTTKSHLYKALKILKIQLQDTEGEMTHE